MKDPKKTALVIPRAVVFWGGGVLFLGLALWLLKGVLLPFVAGFALAYLLDPLADRLQRIGMGRILAATIILVCFVLVVVMFIAIMAPLLADQFQALIREMPGYISKIQDVVTNQLGWIRQTIGGELPPVGGSVGGIVSKGAEWIGNLLSGVLAGGAALVSIASLLVITPVVAFYMLVDWDRMIATVDGWLPRDNRDTIRGLAREMDAAVSGFVRGQAMVSLIQGVAYAISLSLIGLNFGLLIGIISGIIGFIPYVGSIVGFLLAGGVAIAQFWPDYWMIGGVLAIFMAGQFLEGNVLQPNLVGRSVGLHPVWLMFALLAFGSLFGFVGVLLAVPAAAAIGVLSRFGLQQYLESPLYTGQAEPARKTPRA